MMIEHNEIKKTNRKVEQKKYFEMAHAEIMSKYKMSEDRWMMIRFEYLCQFASIVANGDKEDYHSLLNDQEFINYFDFQYKMNDARIAYMYQYYSYEFYKDKWVQNKTLLLNFKLLS